MNGAAVYDRDNQNLGDIKDIILDSDGRVAAVILNVAPHLGLDGKSVAVAMSDVTVTNDNNKPRFTVAMTKDQLKAAPAYPELAGSVRWLRANPILAAGVLLIAAQLWWQAGLLGRSFFRLDDYIYLEHASSSGLTWSYLTWVDAGHLDVVGSAIVWVLGRISPEEPQMPMRRYMGSTAIS